jgi:hypothetical protein
VDGQGDDHGWRYLDRIYERMIVTPPSSSPTFIACGARSGSTLLRRLLDSHPAIACPAETDFALLMEAFLRTGGVLLGADDGSAPNPLVAEARGVIDGLASRHLERVGKDRWCDKSLSNVLHLDTLAAAWPDARFILLHRHVMDFIASALDAQPWGLSEFGFASFAAETPGDPVNALAAYWLDRTYRLLAFEQGHPQRCLSLRYEDLVARTDEVLDMLWGFLKVSPEPDAVARAFQPRDNRASGIGSAGRGDNKTRYTSGVHASRWAGERVDPSPDRRRNQTRWRYASCAATARPGPKRCRCRPASQGPPSLPHPDTEHGLFRQVATLVAQMPEASA